MSTKTRWVGITHDDDDLSACNVPQIKARFTDHAFEALVIEPGLSVRNIAEEFVRIYKCPAWCSVKWIMLHCAMGRDLT